jgi:hypothetical protein
MIGCLDFSIISIPELAIRMSPIAVGSQSKHVTAALFPKNRL